MTPLQTLYTDAVFRLSGLTWLEGLDLLLVMAAFYLLLSFLRRSRAGFLLRGTLALSAVLLLVTIILPLPTFDWLIRVLLIALLVGTPIIFQPELRRLLERLGRNTGMAPSVRQTAAESVLSSVLQAVESLSINRTGALIVLEGRDSLQDCIETGVAFGGRVTSELLQSIFHPGTPLHDGAVILREDHVEAAGCVLPLTQRPLYSQRRLGTRHRAAVGLSESCDALVVIVSEETGEVSVARQGQLHRPLNKTNLREQIITFFVPSASTPSTFVRGRLLAEIRSRLQQYPPSLIVKQLFSNSSLFFVSLLLALAAWSFVVEQTNPAQQFRVDTIPVRVMDIPSGSILVSPAPTSVSAVVQTTASVRPSLRPGSFQAVVSLDGLGPGLHHLPVQVNTGAGQVRVLSIDPPVLDLELASVISRTFPVAIDLPDQQSLSPAYKLTSSPVASPEQVQITGPASLVEKLNRVQATISVANAGSTLQEMRPLRALDQDGSEISGLTLEPNQVQVRVPLQRRLNARDVGVRVVTQGTPPVGYWLSGLSVTPANVTLQGTPDRLSELSNYVDTLPVDVSQAVGDLKVQIPLDLPAQAKALDSEGNAITAVTVLAQITARSGDLVTTRSVELVGVTPNLTVTVSPPRVNLLLSGPLPTLNEIEANDGMIAVWVNVGDLSPGESSELAPTIIAPNGIEAKLMPPSVLLTVDGSPYAWNDKLGPSP